MMITSRHDLLRASGASLPGEPLSEFQKKARDSVRGVSARALDATPVYSRRDEESQVSQTLKPDQVVEVLDSSRDGWFGIQGGYVPRRAMQPILPYETPTNIQYAYTGEFWAEVIAPTATARRFPRPDAKIGARLHFGAALRITDVQVDDWDNVWYRTPRADSVCWVQGEHARILAERDMRPLAPNVGEKQVWVDLARRRLIAYERALAVLLAPIATSLTMCGRYHVTALIPARELPGEPFRLGVPWTARLTDAISLYGAYWHNDFGYARADFHEPGIQLPPSVARWLYRWLSVGTVVRLV